MNKPAISFLALATCVLAGWIAAAAADGTVETLRGADAAAADSAPVEKVVLGKRPGRQQPIARTFDGQPPLIPHAVENFDEITGEDNQCLSCHDQANFEKKQAPLIGESHFAEADGQSTGTLDSRRWFCNQCHVPQHDAPPLVENVFEGTVTGTVPRRQ